MRFTLIVPAAATLLLGILFSGPVLADDTPATLAGATLVSAEDVVQAAAGGAKLIDTRIASEYAEGHLKGAMSVPYREKSAKSVDFDSSQDEFDLTKLPSDKEAAIVMYCNGPECWKSFKGSQAAIKGGYTNIHWYRMGFPDWKSKGLPTE
jgi:rhodanese-related sulfurtransferase